LYLFEQKKWSWENDSSFETFLKNIRGGEISKKTGGRGKRFREDYETTR